MLVGERCSGESKPFWREDKQTPHLKHGQTKHESREGMTGRYTVDEVITTAVFCSSHSTSNKQQATDRQKTQKRADRNSLLPSISVKKMWLQRPASAFLSSALLAFVPDKISSYWTGEIASEERIIFFPTAAHELNETHYSVPLHGWVIEPEEQSKKRKALIKIITKSLKVTDPDEQAILKRRVCGN